MRLVMLVGVGLLAAAPPSKGPQMITAARDLKVGTTLKLEDLAPGALPEGASVGSRFDSEALLFVVGQTLRIPLLKGDPVMRGAVTKVEEPGDAEACAAATSNVTAIEAVGRARAAVLRP